MSKPKRGRTTPARIRPLRLVPPTDPVLHGVAVAEIPDASFRTLVARMHVTCQLHNGMAIAAPQVGVNVRLIVLESGVAVLNPTIHEERGPNVRGTEGCLTFPNRWWTVPRRREVTVAGFDPVSEALREFTAEDVGARMWQHEVDHLDGLLLDGRFDEITDRVNGD